LSYFYFDFRTFFIDVDEYLTYNSIADNERFYTRLSSNDPNSSYMLKDDPSLDLISKESRDCMVARTRLPKHIVDKTVGQFILNEANNIPWNSSKCIVLPRLLFGVKEENLNLLNRGVPTGFDVKNFTTIRYFWHAQKGSYDNKAGKTLADVSRIHDLNSIRNPHSLFIECGGIGSGFPRHVTSLLRVNHYTMSKEAYLAKSDYRRENSSTVCRY